MEEDLESALKDPFVRLGFSDVDRNTTRQENFKQGVRKFKRAFLGFCNDEPRFYFEDELSARMVRLGMFGSEDQAREWLAQACPAYPSSGSYCLSIKPSRGPRGERGYEISKH